MSGGESKSNDSQKVVKNHLGIDSQYGCAPIDIGDPGATTMSGAMDNAKNGIHTLDSIIGDLMDEALNNIRKNPKTAMAQLFFGKDKNDLADFSISDNITNGFEGLMEEGENNRFNERYKNPERHKDNGELSEFGTGGTNAMMICCKVVKLITKTGINEEWKYVELTWNWSEMCRINTRKPDAIEITEEKYKKYHPYPCGSTFKFMGLNKKYFTKDFDTEKEKILNICKHNYSKIIYD